MPGTRPDRFVRAIESGADRVIIDLEDAVASSDKSVARAAAAAWISPAHPVLVRINAVDSDWFSADLEICSQPGVVGVVIPKSESLEGICIVSAAIGPAVSVFPLIETAQGVANAVTIASGPNVSRLMFGSVDLQADLAISGNDRELAYFRSHLVLASRLAGCQSPIDGVTTVLDSTRRVQIDALRAKRLGFGGKLCIHPKQIAIVNACFHPDAAEVAWAKRIADAAATTHGGVLVVDGEMADKPVLARARAILLAAGKS